MTDRGFVEFVSPEAIEPTALTAPFSQAPLSAQPLVGSLAAGDGAALVMLPDGWRADARTTAPFELIVLEGELAAGADTLGRYGYLSAIPGEPLPAIVARGTVLAFVDANPQVRVPQVVPYSEDGWTAGNMPGLTRKLIRGELDGARGFFLRIPAGWSEHRTEWHDCAEAALMLEGDLWHVRANGGAGGTMRRHCYFWRPRHVLHSPMGSDEGAMSWVYVDALLVNHFVEEGGAPPASAGAG